MARPVAPLRSPLAGGSRRFGEQRKKRVSVADLDELLYRHAQSIFGDAPEPDPLPEAEFVDLGYSLARAYLLWTAWDKHGTMPKAGGLDDQPQKWIRMIHLVNRYFSPAFMLARDEHLPPGGNHERGSGSMGEDYESMFGDAVDAPRRGFDELMRG